MGSGGSPGLLREAGGQSPAPGSARQRHSHTGSRGSRNLRCLWPPRAPSLGVPDAPGGVLPVSPQEGVPRLSLDPNRAWRGAGGEAGVPGAVQPPPAGRAGGGEPRGGPAGEARPPAPPPPPPAPGPPRCAGRGRSGPGRGARSVAAGCARQVSPHRDLAPRCSPVLSGFGRGRAGGGGRGRGGGGGGSPAAPRRASPGELPGLPSPATPPVPSAAGAGAGPGGTPGIPSCSGRTAAPGARRAPTPPLPSPGSPRLGRSCPRAVRGPECRSRSPLTPHRGIFESRIPPTGVPQRPAPADGAPPFRITDPGSFGSVSAVPSPGLNTRVTSGRPGGTVPRPCGGAGVGLALPLPSGYSELCSLRGSACSGLLGVGSVRARPWGVLVQLHRVTAPSSEQREMCPYLMPGLTAFPRNPNSTPGWLCRGLRTPALKSCFHRWGEGHGTSAPRGCLCWWRCAGLSQRSSAARLPFHATVPDCGMLTRFLHPASIVLLPLSVVGPVEGKAEQLMLSDVALSAATTLGTC